jgi:hypothetical protein
MSYAEVEITSSVIALILHSFLESLCSKTKTREIQREKNLIFYQLVNFRGIQTTVVTSSTVVFRLIRQSHDDFFTFSRKIKCGALHVTVELIEITTK